MKPTSSWHKRIYPQNGSDKFRLTPYAEITPAAPTKTRYSQNKFSWTNMGNHP